MKRHRHIEIAHVIGRRYITVEFDSFIQTYIKAGYIFKLYLYLD